MTYFLFFGSISILAASLRRLISPSLIGIVIGVFLATFAALRGSDVAADFIVYQDWYTNRDLSNGFLERPGLFEAVYFTLNDFFEACAMPFRVFIWFLAFTAVFIKINVIHSFSKSSLAFGTAIVSYMFTFYLLHDFTQIRVGLAIALIFLAVNSLVEGARRQYLLLVFLAAGFHSSALMAFLLLLPHRGGIADWLDRCLISIAVGSVILTAYGITFDARLVDVFFTLDPRISQYISISEGVQAEATNPFAIRALLLFVLALSLSVIKMNGPWSFGLEKKDFHAIVLVRRSILIGLSCLFLMSPVPELAIRLFEINASLIPILVAIIFSYRGWFLQKFLLVLWIGSIFYVFVFLDEGLVKPYALFFA